MIYVTGDTHGSITRFDDKTIARMKKEDYLIICGDFGFIWDGNRQEEKALNFLARQKFTILFVDGCHENFDRLYKYPTSDWNGGRVRRIKPNVIHLCRGQVYTIDGVKIFAMGGGCSSDLDLRQQRGTKWWAEETPTTAEMTEAVDNLYRHDLQVDYIITHECPTKVKDLLEERIDNFNAMTAFLDELGRQVTYKHWFFGNMHQDKHLSSSHTALFQRVLPLRVPGQKEEKKPLMHRFEEERQLMEQQRQQAEAQRILEAEREAIAAEANEADELQYVPVEPAPVSDRNRYRDFDLSAISAADPDFGGFDDLDNDF